MDFIRAITYPFSDAEWPGKLLITALLTFSIALFPLGFLTLALLLGYSMAICGNVMRGVRPPMPRWVHYGDWLSDGVPILVALFIYYLPILLIIAAAFAISSINNAILTGLFSLVLACCLFPLTIVYSLLAWALLARGFIRYQATGQGSSFFQIGRLWGEITTYSSETIQWLVSSLAVNILLSILAIIPCLGWVAMLALAIPAQAHLLGQYARITEGKTKRKRGA